MLEQALKGRLEERRSQHLYRERLILSGSQQHLVASGDTDFLSFASNNYLGLASDPRICTAISEGMAQFGVGSASSQLVTGHHEQHQCLERQLARFLGYPRTLIFTCGYMANLAVLTTLVGRNDVIYADRENHASLNDGALLSSARFKRYRHVDMVHLSRLLVTTRKQFSQALIVSDSVFSMSGDLAPLKEIGALAQKNNSSVLVDDAHGLGWLGGQGRGALDFLDLSFKDIPLLTGTFSKSFGVQGAFVAGSEIVIESLVQFARPYIYTTAMLPALASGILEGLRIIEQADEQRAHLAEMIDYFKVGANELGLELLASNSPIQPIVMGSAEKTLEWSQYLRASGVLVKAIRYPSVPKGQARLLVMLNAHHQKEHLDILFDVIARGKENV